MKRILLSVAIVTSPVHAGSLAEQGLDDPHVAAPRHGCFFIFPEWRVPCARSSLPPSSSEREGGDGRGMSAVPLPEQEESVLGTPVVDRGSKPPNEPEFQDKETYFGGRQNFGNWTDKQRDFHKTGNPNWAECDCPKVAE